MGKATLLIVENDDTHALLLKKILSRQGYAIAGLLASGEGASTFLTKTKVDVILMAFNLAGSINGLDTARIIHETSEIPIIFLTTPAESHLIEEASTTGPCDFIQKPVGEQQLIITLKIVLHRHALDRKLRQRQKALEKSEAEALKKIQAHLGPDGDIGTLTLGDVIDGSALQTMMEDFHQLTGIGIGIFDTVGKVLVGVGWQDICVKFHRCHPKTLMNCLKSTAAESRGRPVDDVRGYRCKNNLWVLMTPIELGGQHVGNVCLGHFFYDDEILDYEFFRNQAKTHGFDEAAYLAALDRVPRFSREKVTATLAFYRDLSRLISSLSYKSIMLSRTLAEKDLVLQELSENRAFQMSLLENIPIPVFSKDTEGRYLVCNSAYKDFFGKTSEQIITANAFSLHPPELAQVYHEKDDELFRTGQSQIYETKLRNGRGELRDGLVHKALLIDRNGIATGLVGAILDITERNRAEEDKKRLQSQLMQSQKMEAIGTLAGGIAHDFNNILGAIIGYAEMVQDDCPSDSTISHDLEQILQAGNRAKDLVKQILAFSRQSETERIRLQPATIIKETVKLLRASLPTTIAILPTIDPATSSIFADPIQIHQLVMNLCTNAFHAMEERGGTLSISLGNVQPAAQKNDDGGNQQTGRFIHLSISDTGTGIVPEVGTKIFDPYFTTKEIGKGTGMGLAIAHGIVEGYGGTITFDSHPGQGTTFHITLPALLEIDRLQTPPSSTETGTPPGAEHILFIDDEKILVDMTGIMLERLGYHVTVATSSTEALTIFSKQPDAYDLVITDQTMPNMTGIELARHMLKIRPNLPIILCTGYSSLISDDKAKASGIKGIAMKPLTKRDIAKLIGRVLTRKE